MSAAIGFLGYIVLALIAGISIGRRFRNNYPTSSADSEPTPLSDFQEFSEGNHAKS